MAYLLLKFTKQLQYTKYNARSRNQMLILLGRRQNMKCFLKIILHKKLSTTGNQDTMADLFKETHGADLDMGKEWKYFSVEQRFLNHSTTPPWYFRLAPLLGHPVYCRKFSSISGLHPLNVSSSPVLLLWQPEISPDMIKCHLGGQNHSQFRTTV